MYLLKSIITPYLSSYNGGKITNTYELGMTIMPFTVKKKGDYMEKTKPYKQSIYTFFKSAIIHPKQNIDSHNDLPVIKNIVLYLPKYS